LLGADSVHQALVTTKYQEQVVGADRAAVDKVERLRRQVEALAAKRAAWSRSAARSSPAWPPSAATTTA